MWVAISLGLGCANATYEPADGRSSGDAEPSEGSMAGQPSDAPTEARVPSWCDARAVLESKCQRCHADEPENGAPFSLMTYADVHAKSKKGKPRYEAIARTLESELMPPSYLELEPPVLALTEDEHALLLAWCEQGAPGDGSDECPRAE